MSKYWYNVSVTEHYKGSPTAQLNTNFGYSKTCETLNEVNEEVLKSLKEIHRDYRVLREWCEQDSGVLTKKVLFERKNATHGRLLRKISVRRLCVQAAEEFSLI